MPESYKEDGRPAQQWYWDDWFSAFDVRLCGLASRGLWIDMLGIMFKAEIRGTLTVNGKKINSKTLAKIVGATEVHIERLLKELERHDVFSRLDDGTIICRRMFRESGKRDQISKIRAEVGKKGAEKRWQKIAKMATASPSPSSSAIASPSSKSIVEQRKAIIDYFNKTTGQKRSYTCDETNKLINGRLDEGKTLKDFKHVIDTKTVQWLNDSKMRKFIRPSTLFRPGNFEDYLNEPYENPKKIAKTGQVGVDRQKHETKFPGDFLHKVYALLRKQKKDGNKYADLIFALSDAEAKAATEKYKDNPAGFIKFLEAKK